MQFVHFALLPVQNIVISLYLLSAAFIKEFNWEQELMSVLLESVVIWSQLTGIKFDMKLYFVLLNSISELHFKAWVKIIARSVLNDQFMLMY